MGIFLQDLRYGVRMLWKSPGFTLVAVVALALGIGANTAIFSVVNTVLLRSLPFAEPDRLLAVYNTNVRRGTTTAPTSFLNFADVQAQNQVFEQMAAYNTTSAALTGVEAPEQIDCVETSTDLFPLLRVEPLMGRVLTREDERPGAERAIVISQGAWQRRFGGDPQIVGRQLTLDSRQRTIVGVLPEGFRFPLDEQESEFWAPLMPDEDANKERGSSYLSVVARLKPGVTPEQALAEMNVIAARLAAAHPAENTGRGINLVGLHEATVGSVRPALLVLLGAVGFVLLIACANVANLLLARSTSRGKEIAVRTALGASRGRVVRQLLTESLLLALLGGTLGLLLALWGIDLLAVVIPENLPRISEINLDGRVLAFTSCVSLMTGLVFGLAPALQASKLDLNETLKEGSRGSTGGARRNRVRSALVITEVALSLVLLIGAGLLIRSFLRLREVNPGFNPQRAMTASIALPQAKYDEPAEQAAFFRQVLERMASVPGVEAAGVVDPLPLTGDIRRTSFELEDRPAPPPGERLIAHGRSVNADYLRAMGIQLVRGRALTEQDSAEAPRVMLINETLAKRYFPGEDPVGKRVSTPSAPHWEIVGVTADVKHDRLDAAADPEYYLSYFQSPQPIMSLVVRTTSGEPLGIAPALRDAVAQVDKEQPVADIRTMSELLTNSVAQQRFQMLLLGIFAGVALMLAAVGIFGVMSFLVAQRTHEVGIRIALGAQSKDILKLVVGQGMVLALVGVCLGLGAALALTRLMSSLLYGVSATDPLTFAGLALLLSVVALIACYVPARRAMRVDPMVALRYE